MATYMAETEAAEMRYLRTAGLYHARRIARALDSMLPPQPVLETDWRALFELAALWALLNEATPPETRRQIEAAQKAPAINHHDALVETLADLIEASTAEANEKGAGGFLLARLTDARVTLARARQRTGT
jgi:hypothetical protein